MKIVLSLSPYLTNRVLLMLLMNHCCVKFESLNMFEVQWSMLCTSGKQISQNMRIKCIM